MIRRSTCALLLALSAWLSASGGSYCLAAADAGQSVQNGRNALGRFWGYPWYDSKADALREVDPPTPRAPEPIAAASSGDSGLLRGLVWTGIIALLMAIVFLLIRFFLNREAYAEDEAEQASTAARIEALPFTMKPGRTDLLEEARRCYGQGDYRHAIIYLFSFELVELDRRGLIRLTKGKTNRQYLREIAARRELRALVEQTMTSFEDVFFGDLDLQRERFEASFFRVDEFARLIAPPPETSLRLAGQGAAL